MTIRSVARLHTFDGEQLTIAQIHARVPVLSSYTVRRYLKAGRHTKADMLSERSKVPCKPGARSQVHITPSTRGLA